MSNIKDSVTTKDTVAAALNAPPSASYLACPKCEKALKEHHEGALICSNRACRHVLVKAERDTAKKVTVASGITAPCPKCGKASKLHHTGDRICSNKACRHEFALPKEPAPS